MGVTSVVVVCVCGETGVCGGKVCVCARVALSPAAKIQFYSQQHHYNEDFWKELVEE